MGELKTNKETTPSTHEVVYSTELVGRIATEPMLRSGYESAITQSVLDAFEQYTKINRRSNVGSKAIRIVAKNAAKNFVEEWIKQSLLLPIDA